MSENQKYLLVTHKKPDLDAVTSIYFWLRAHGILWDQYDEIYQIRFVNPGQRINPDDIDDKSVVIIHFDTGRMHDEYNFDHHHLGARDVSAAGLVWQRFFTEGEDPAIDELARLVNHTDNGIRHDTNDLVARNLFSMGFFLSGANKQSSHNPDFMHTLIVGFSMLDAYIANHHEVEKFENLTKDMEIFDTPFGKTVILLNVPGDSSAIRSFLKKYYNGEEDRGPLVNTCVVQFANGPIGVVVCIDPELNNHDEYQDETENYPDTISLSEEMIGLYDKLKAIDSSPSSNIYLHQSRFALYINRSNVIRLQHVLSAIEYIPVENTAAEA